jgi:hypothetical protein
MKTLLVGLVAVLSLFAFNLGQVFKNKVTLGNAPIGSELNATTTGIGVGFASAINTYTATTSPQHGTLGSVIFTAPTLGIVEFYDATTTNVNLRTGNIASSSLLIAHFPAGTGTSTIEIDYAWRYGLTVVFKGTVSTSTILYRGNLNN